MHTWDWEFLVLTLEITQVACALLALASPPARACLCQSLFKWFSITLPLWGFCLWASETNKEELPEPEKPVVVRKDVRVYRAADGTYKYYARTNLFEITEEGAE